MLNLLKFGDRAWSRSMMTLVAGASVMAACSARDAVFGPRSDSASGAGQGGATSSSTNSATGGTTADGGASSTSTGPSGGGGAGPLCNNGILDPGEPCDGDELGGKNCQDVGFDAPDGLACSKVCDLDTSGCSASCDGKNLEPSEACDGADLAGKDCTTYGYSNGAGINCTAQCEIDATGCKPTCDGMLLEPGEDCDGMALGGKTCVDFGFVTPGGLSCGEDCSADISGCTAVCGNNATEPGEDCDDGNVDPNDGCNQCKFDGKTCGTATGVLLDWGQELVVGNTMGGSMQSSSDQACANGTSQGTAASGERIVAVTPLHDGFLTASLTYGVTNFDAVLYVRTDCSNAQTEMACANNYSQGMAPGGEVVSFYAKKGQTYYMIVDGSSSSGDFELNLDLSQGTCADPVLFPLWKGQPMRAMGTTEFSTNQAQASCGGGMAQDVVYKVTPHTTAVLEAELPKSESNFNTVLYARGACGMQNTQIACDGGGNVIDIDVQTAAGKPFYVWVDGSGQASGSYHLVLDPDKNN